MDNALRPLVMDRAPATTLRNVACERGMQTLRADGWKKVLRGVTTLEEVLRVTRQDDLGV